MASVAEYLEVVREADLPCEKPAWGRLMGR